MFISFDQKSLLSVLSVCNQISKPKNNVEAYTYTKFKLSQDKVFVAALNEYAYFETSIKPISLEDFEEEKEFLIKTDLLYSAINLIKDEIVGMDLKLNKDTLIVQGSKSKHTLRVNTMDLSSFNVPTVDKERDEVRFTLPKDELVAYNRKAFVAAGNPKTVYQAEFLNVCYTVNVADKQLIVASTDRYRVSKQVVPVELNIINNELEKKNYLILPKPLQLIENIESEMIDVSLNRDYYVAKGGDSQMVLRYGEGIYPDYERILPQSFVCSFTVTAEEIIDQLKQVQFSARINSTSSSVLLKVQPSENKVVLTSTSENGYESEAAMDIIDYEGATEPWEQAFNIDYLMSYIQTLKTSHFTWEANPGKPSVLSPKGEKEKELYLVSGLR